MAGAEPAISEYFQSNWAHIFIFLCSLLSIAWGMINVLLIRQVKLEDPQPIEDLIDDDFEAEANRINDEEGDAKKTRNEIATGILDELVHIGDLVTDGAIQFLKAEYTYLGLFCLVFSILIGFTVDLHEMSDAFPNAQSNFPYTAAAFLVGAGTSIAAGYIGMRIAVYTNNRTTYNCCKGKLLDNCDVPDTGADDGNFLDNLVKFYDITDKNAKDAAGNTAGGKWTKGQVKCLKEGFMTAFQGGQVLGFTLVGLALLILEILLLVYKATWFDVVLPGVLKAATDKDAAVSELVRRHFEFIAGYGLGGSTVALFGRVGGGIYTKAADVGADLVGKVVAGLEEDSPENPGTIADNVGDNVGDIAGMGADLFGSLAESTCAALVVSSTSVDLIKEADALYFPLIVTAVGIIASFVSVLCANFFTVTQYNVQSVLKAQLGISTALMTVALIPAVYILPDSFSFKDEKGVVEKTTTSWQAYGCIMFGLWSGMIIGFATEYYTSNSYAPTLKLYKTCRQGAATNVIQGLALGYESCIIPIFCITATIAYSFAVAGMYGIGLAAIGMLGSLPVALTIDGYGPISDNAGGIAEMSGLPPIVRERTDALDAAGNTTAAIGKGFAIGSACLVGLALFGAFVTRIQMTSVDILKPIQFSGLLIGAMLPYWFSALTMVAVGDAAEAMMYEIQSDMADVEAKRAAVASE
jgi:inorganic pyrophosphatase